MFVLDKRQHLLRVLLLDQHQFMIFAHRLIGHIEDDLAGLDALLIEFEGHRRSAFTGKQNVNGDGRSRGE